MIAHSESKASLCKGCGAPIQVKAVGKRREFCGARFCYLKCRASDATCETCGNPFRGTITAGGRGGKIRTRRFCSVACKNKGLVVVRRKVCVICSIEFSAKDRRTQACSHKCGQKLARLSHPTLPATTRGVVAMMDMMPDNAHALTNWFMSMAPEQLDRVWVQAVIDLLPVGQIAPFANALVAVRDAYRARLIARPL